MPASFPLPAAQPGVIGSDVLNGPPPSPMLGGPLQAPGALGSGSSRQLSPEVLMGLMQAGNTINEMLNSMAQMVPDLAQELVLAQEGIKGFLAKVLLAGGGPTSQAQAGTPMPNGLPPSPSPSM